MTDLRVAHLRKRYRLPHGDVDGRARLDRAVARALDDALLEGALDALGMRDGEEVCVRRLHVAARLPRGGRETALAAAWSLAAAQALDAALRDGAEVVRYGSRHQAMRELVRRAPRGDLSRAWAWRQLGLWTLGDAAAPARVAGEIVALLAREPQAAVALLAESAAAGTLPTLVAGAPAAAWRALAAAVLARAGASPALADAPATADDVATDPLGTTVADTAVEARIDSSGATPLALAFAAALRATGTSTPAESTLVRALATLAVVHAEPALARTAPARAARLVARAATRLVHSAAREDAPAPRPRDRAAAHAAAHAAAPHTPPTPHAPRALRDDEDADVQPADARPRARTDAAGVLFLLHLVRALDVPALVAATDALRDRPLRWVLHRIAVDALGLDARDPAALAFAGITDVIRDSAPVRHPRESGGPAALATTLDPRMREDDGQAGNESPVTSRERDAIDALIARLTATLRVWLPGEHPESDTALLARVCRRRGEIVADPAWIEAWLPLDEVDPLVRRAGLDVDPDWCPFIGAVVRFHYV